jgi:hypothetical protein
MPQKGSSTALESFETPASQPACAMHDSDPEENLNSPEEGLQ